MLVKLFGDMSDAEEVKKAAEWGILDGVTNNPTLIAKNGPGGFLADWQMGRLPILQKLKEEARTA